VKIELLGRTDFDDLFAISELFDGTTLNHNPLLAFIIDDDICRVQLVHNSDDLLTDFEDNVQIMAQWPGKWRSDWFKFTVHDFKQWYKANYA